MLKCCHSRKKYLSKLKQHRLPDALGKELSFECLSVMVYEQFTVPIVELIMLLRQSILFFNFHESHLAFLSLLQVTSSYLT